MNYSGQIIGPGDNDYGRASLSEVDNEDLQSTIPRRNKVWLFTEAELAIHKAVHAVEAAGCDVRLTNAINKLHEAKEWVSDFVDGVIREPDNKLPSAHQLGDKVELQFGISGTLTDCEIIKVHFSESKVLYDVEVTGEYDSEYQKPSYEKWHTRLYNVDSCFVTKAK